MTRPLLAILLLAGCADPFIPEGTVRIDPPPEYRVWWEASRACVAKREWVAFERVEWYITPDYPVSSDGQAGAALAVENRIYIVEWYRDQPWVIQHELVHVVNAIHGHPADPFYRCHLMNTQQ